MSWKNKNWSLPSGDYIVPKDDPYYFSFDDPTGFIQTGEQVEFEEPIHDWKAEDYKWEDEYDDREEDPST